VSSFLTAHQHIRGHSVYGCIKFTFGKSGRSRICKANPARAGVLNFKYYVIVTDFGPRSLQLDRPTYAPASRTMAFTPQCFPATTHNF